ncbi:hypothetical protein [Candidatus Korobacter versatilis]|uniref:hypothetical protein n=1 Tax=Candidatus Korobacter versatilis TaxID=658062 RepID=UPI0011D069BB|nr:hypothetical protein [Candidatus Koribacter versatilis]
MAVRFRLYAAAKGGTALWQEVQTVTVQDRKFTALIGAASTEGVPLYWFSSTQARWLEVQLENELSNSRIQLASVPYALKAADADLFGGRRISDFVLRTNANTDAAAKTNVTYATLGANSFVGDQGVNGSVNVSGYVNTALATVASPLVVNQLLWVNSTATTGGVISVKAENASSSGTGIMGIVTSATGNTVGVIGRSDSVVGNGVYGVTTAASGSAEAISGTARALQGHGVGGYAVNTSGTNVGVFGKSYSSQGTGVWGEVSPPANGYTTYGVVGKTHGYPGIALYGVADAASGNNIGVMGSVTSSAGTGGVFVNAASGNVLIGVAGSKNVFRVDGTGKVFANGGVQNSGADFAESIAVRGNRAAYEPGDVLVIDEDTNREVTLSSEPYSTLIAGVYSTKPGTLSSPHGIDSPALEAEVPMAVIGIVPCKVTTENGPIHRGDLLVTSSLRGYAMKGTDRQRLTGAIVGKALQDLPEGTGVIEILVTLQ